MTDPALAPAISDGEAPSGDLFFLLERQIERLVAKHRESRKSIEELQAAVADRDRRLASLEQQIAASYRLRASAAERVEALIDRVDRLQKNAEQAGVVDEDTPPLLR